MSKIDDLLDNPAELDRGLTGIRSSLTKKFIEDLEKLYAEAVEGLAPLDTRERPQGDTINSSSKIGKLLLRFCGLDNRTLYGMSVIGCMEYGENGDGKWVMQPAIRAALQRLNWFGPAPSSKKLTRRSVSPPCAPAADPVELAQREARFMLIEVRQEQARFRRAVFNASSGTCAISGCPVPEALEAAHLKGRKWREGDNAASDGILLRRDLHALYDRDLLSIDIFSGAVQIDPRVLETYGEFQNIQIRLIA